jgi:hypothetical protein
MKPARKSFVILSDCVLFLREAQAEREEAEGPATVFLPRAQLNHELRTANCELRTANCELRTANCELFL